MTQNIFNSKISLCILISLLLLTSSIGLGIYFNYYIVDEQLKFNHDNAYNLYPDNLISLIDGYEQNDNRLLAQNDDPKIYFWNPSNVNISSMLVQLSNPVAKSSSIQVFYTNESLGDYREENSVTATIPEGVSEITLSLPSGNYPELRYDINILNEEFEITNILLSDLPAESILVRHYPKEFSVLIITLLINLTIILIWLKIRKRHYFDNINNILFHLKRNRQNANKPAFVFYHSIYVILFCVFLTLLISLCFFNNATPIAGVFVDMKGQLLMALVFMVVLALLYNISSVLRNIFILVRTSFLSKLLIAFSCLFVVQLFLVINISTSIGWDVGVIFSSATVKVDADYLGVFPNNLLLFFILKSLTGLFQLIGLSNFWLGFSIVNVLLIDLSLLIAIITIRKINPAYESRLLLFILFSLLIGLSPWTIVPYSDTFSMPFVSLLVLFCLLTVQAKTTVKRLNYAALCGLTLAIGWLLKSTIIAVMAALAGVFVLYLLRMRGKINMRLLIVALAVTVLSFAVFMGLFNLYVSNQTLVNVDRSQRTPMSYTIATGLVERPVNELSTVYGSYSFDVAKLNYGRTEEKNARLIAFIQEKMQDYSISDYLLFLFNKARWITSEGNFFWLGEGTADFSNPNGNFLKDLLYNNGKYYPFWFHAVNGLWIVVFLGCCFGMLCSWTRGSTKNATGFDADLFIQLCALFIILLILFVEGRSRYLISFLPLFCMVSAIGYSYIIKAIKKIIPSN